MRLEPGQQAFRFEFKEELCCCVGAEVLRLRVCSRNRALGNRL
jgi:hypothetical protein